MAERHVLFRVCLISQRGYEPIPNIVPLLMVPRHNEDYCYACGLCLHCAEERCLVETIVSKLGEHIALKIAPGSGWKVTDGEAVLKALGEAFGVSAPKASE